jgi:hypothetical protein
MDRLIALLAALVGLIALGGALLVHNAATIAQQRQATEIAQLKASVSILTQAPAGSSPAPVVSAPPAEDGTADALLALQSRIVTLEQTTKSQAADLEAARTALANIPAQSAALPTDTSAIEPPAQSATPAALTADGPTTDCIPLGTRFMAAAGDSFPICKTKAVVTVSSVADGSAIVEGAGPVAAGGFGNLPAPGCTVMVFTADLSGYAEMRVTCV